MSKNKIINFYEKIPHIFLNDADNPNYKFHLIKIPFRMCVVAPSGSGKTNFLLNLIHLFSKGKNGTFATINIITANKDEPLYKWLGQVNRQILISEGIKSTPELDNFDKQENHLVVWDDLILSKDLSKVVEYYIRARKKNVSVIFLSQSFFAIPKIIRINCSYLVILKLSGERDANLIFKEFSLGISKDKMIELYNYATREKLESLIIDINEQAKTKFRKGFLEILNIT